MSPDLVSIIMPAYNAERFIGDAIRSVLEQTYTDWELIVVDDGSTDSTATIIRHLESHDSRIHYVFQKNGLQGKARNTGIEKSTGSFIAFLDSDDLWIPTKLEKQTEAIAKKNADVVFSDAYLITDEECNNETTLKSAIGQFSGRDFFDSLVLHNQIPVLTVLLNRAALAKVGLFEEGEPFQGCEDYDLWLRLAKAGCVFYGMSEALARYRRHDGATTAIASNALKPMLQVIRRHIDDSRLGESEKQKRITGLYRDIIAALVDEGKLSEAKQLVNEMCLSNKHSIVAGLQKLLINFWPRKYNFISREFLYRTEWHLQNRFRRGKRAH